MLSKNKNKKPLAWKKSTKINFNAKCSCTLNLPTLTPNVHPTKQLLYFLWLKWFSLWGPHQQGEDLPINSISLSSKCSITSKGGFKWPFLGDSLFLPKIKQWSSGIWRETNCDPMAGVAGVLDPLTVPWILTSLLFYSLSALLTLKLQLVQSGHSRRWAAPYSWRCSPRNFPVSQSFLQQPLISPPNIFQSTSPHWRVWELPRPLLVTHGPSGFARIICVVNRAQPDHYCSSFPTRQPRGTQPPWPALLII